MAFPEQFLTELMLKTDIEDLISSYVTLKRRGNTLVGLCPFHNEKTPSFTVYPQTQSFYCFGCGAGGDAVTFIKSIENLDYVDAVGFLAQRAGMNVPREDYHADNSLSKKRRRILEANREAARFYHSYLLSEDGRAALEYYHNRTITNKTITKFGLGYAPNKWDSLIKHLKSKGFSISELIDAGLAKQGAKGCYDMFINRVMTPIIDVKGNVIAFGGRVLDDSKPKYINTGETLVYKKTNELFGLNFAKESKENSLILCEGYMDVIAMHQAGFDNAVAGCGTALTPEQIKLISRYSDEVVLIYDSDEAGQKALDKALRLFKSTTMKIKVPVLSGGKDPDEIIKTYGRDKFKGMLDGAVNSTDFAILKLKNKYNLSTTQGKIEFLNDVIKILADLSPIEQDIYASRLAEELDVDKQSIRLQLNTYERNNKRKQNRKEYTKAVSDSVRNNIRLEYDTGLPIKLVKAEESLAGLLVAFPECVGCINGMTSEDFSTSVAKQIVKIILDRNEQGLDFGLYSFSDKLSKNEMNKLSKLVAIASSNQNPSAECRDCVSLIRNEKLRLNISKKEEISDDEFRNFFKNNKKSKS